MMNAGREVKIELLLTFHPTMKKILMKLQ